MWFCNTIIPQIGKKINLLYLKPESWITAIYAGIRNYSEIQLIYLFPNNKFGECYIEQNAIFVEYSHYAKNLSSLFVNILNHYRPDVIQVFGTENPDVLPFLDAVKQCGMLNITVLNIQGLLSTVAKHYTVGLPASVIYASSLRDFILHNNINNQKKCFGVRAKQEQHVIATVKHIIGRTDMDLAITKSINHSCCYHHCNESLRPSFYTHKWVKSGCEQHSIFVSQSNYPIKGFHLMLEAMREIVVHYPDAKLYTTGKNPMIVSFCEVCKQTYYQKYLNKLIRKFRLQDHVFFLGTLNEQEMCDRFLHSHVFVCCSTIENSPNSVGEAMILGVPVVSSDVGGVKNMLVHEREGFLYQADATYMLAYYVMKYFEHDEIVEAYTKAARNHALKTHNQKQNLDTLMQIYKVIKESNIT